MTFFLYNKNIYLPLFSVCVTVWFSIWLAENKIKLMYNQSWVRLIFCWLWFNNKTNPSIYILSTQSEEFEAIYPSIQWHFSSRQMAYLEPEHWSLTKHDWFKGRIPKKKWIIIIFCWLTVILNLLFTNSVVFYRIYGVL